MRRNMSRGNRRGGGASFGGPLMTDHLKDLDLELQLLKRKRQMIEQQQQQRMMGRQQRGYIYDQPQTYKEQPYDYEEQQERTSNYSHMYDESPNSSYSNKFGNQLGRKRQVESPWDNGAPPKRFSGPKGKYPKKPFGDRPGRSLDRTPEPMGRRQLMSGKPSRSPNTPQSLMSLKPKPPPGPRRPAPQSAQHNYKSGRVTKPKPVAVNNKLDSYPVDERKKLVAEASNLVSETDDRVLSVDRVPTQQMTGRLELALGGILKDLKQAYGQVQPHANSFQSAYLQRAMKQFIRERIRSVMLGKVVGNVADILSKYRKVFPTNTDTDILDAALDAQEKIEKKKFGIKLVEAEGPEEYFSVNMQRLIDVTLNDMFSKLHELYGNSAYKESMEDVSPKEGNQSNNTSKVDEITSEIDYSKVDETTSEIDGSKVDETTSEIDGSKVDETTSEMDASKVDETTSEIETSKLNETNPVDDTSKANETTPEMDASKADETNAETDTSKVDETTTKIDASNLNETTAENDANKLNETSTENEASTADETSTDIDGNKDGNTSKIIDDSTLDDAVKLNDSDAAKPVDEPKSSNDDKFYKKLKVFKPNSPESKKCEQFIETAIKRRLPKLLRKQIPNIIKLLNLGHMYRTASAAIIRRSAEKAGVLVKESDVGKKSSANKSLSKDGDDSSNVTAEQDVKMSTPGPSRYFVKIIARPSLPKRKVMQTFLNDFNPRTIKKHKNMHSLLFVGFTEQEDFERILAATGTIIAGRTTLEIKVSEKANDKNKSIEKQDTAEVKVDATGEQVSLDSSLDNLISNDLDDKINDLLSSIRQAEEQVGGEASDSTAAPIEIADDKIEEVTQNEKSTDPAKQNDIVKNEEKGEPQKESTQNDEETADKEKASQSLEQTNDSAKELNTIDESAEADIRVEALKNDAKESGKATPTRASSRLASSTPGTIRTRRASRLAQNNP